MRTRLQLVEAVREACGFMPWLVVSTDMSSGEPLAGEAETMAGMIERMRVQLGIFAPQEEPAPQTLAELRASMMRLLGYGVQAENPPPGMTETLNRYVNEAQQIVHRRLEMALTSAPPAFMEDDGDTTSVDPTIVFEVAMSLATAHYAKPDAKVWLDRSERMLSDRAQRNPPNITERLRLALVDAQRTLARRYQVTQDENVTIGQFWQDEDEPTFDPQAVFLLALSNMKAALGQPDAKIAREDWLQYLADMERRLPANAIRTITRYVIEANHTLFSRYESLRQPQDYTIALVDGQSDYLLADEGIDFERITEIGIQRDGLWYSLRHTDALGARYSYPNDTGWPSRYTYQGGGVLQVWPTPGAEAQNLILRARSVLAELEGDDSEPSVDDHAIFLHATAAAKGFFRQPDAQLYLRDLDAYIRERVAASHGTKRYNADRRHCLEDATAPSPYPLPATPYP